MSKITFLCVFTTLVFQFSYGQRENKFYRKDYHFIEATGSFYKRHNHPRNWQDAKKMCEWEGATLFYPDSEPESDAVLAYMRELHESAAVWIGVFSPIVKGVFVTIGGYPLADVYHKWNTGEPNNLGGNENCAVLFNNGVMNDLDCSGKVPFICKKTLASLKWNTACKMANTDYIYNETLGRCYKFHDSPKSWMEAYTICSSELSYLAVVDSQDEADFFLDVLSSNTELENQPNGTAHLGFHKMFEDRWHTVKGTPVENNEYFIWGEGQPDGADAEKCGAMSFDGQFHDVACSARSSFICEHEILHKP